MTEYVLRGPADADHYRVRVGRYGDRFYTDPLAADAIHEATDDAWPSVSTVKKASGNDWSFVALRRVAESKIDDLAALDTSERYERLKVTNKVGLERAAQRGTNVHTWFERGLKGEPYGVDPLFPDAPGAGYLDAVRDFFATWQPELVACEMVCIDRNLHSYGYGGTTDAVIAIDGRKWWVDWKSRGEDSAHGAYPEEAAQIAAYARAQYVIVEGANGPERIAPPEVDGGLIVSIRPDGCRLYPVDLDKAYEHWTAMHAWWVARRSEREPIGKPWAPRKQSTVEPSAPAPVDQGTGGDPPASPVPADPALIANLAERTLAIKEHPAALATLLVRWPAGTPTFRDGGHTAEHAAAIEAVIVSVERDHEMPFTTPYTPQADDPFDGVAADPPPALHDEGPDVEPGDLEAFAGVYNALDAGERAAVDAWASCCFRDGARSLSLRAKPSRWRWSMLTALIHVARSGSDDDMLRCLLYGATGSEEFLMPANRLGACMAKITTEEADRLGALARALGTDGMTLAFDPDEKPIFSGPAWDAARAAA